MITPEEFKGLFEKVQAGEALTVEESQQLIEVVVELDGQSVLLQNALVLAHDNAITLIETLASQILSRCGRTDKKTKRSVAKMAANGIARFQIATQMYLSGAFDEGNEMVAEQALAEAMEAAGNDGDVSEGETSADE